MPVTVELPDALVARARESAASGGSISDQIERWATLGLEVEAILTEENQRARSGSASSSTSAVTAEDIDALLLSIADSTERSGVIAEIESRGYPLYEADAEDPDLVVQIEADGRRTRGRFLDREFVPAG